MMGKSPAQILNDTNAAICRNNKAEMFVTVWLGILEISTGKLTAANAGHEYPVLQKKPGGSFALLKDKHGFVIGGMPGMKYKDYELQLMPGMRLFLYTDGVPEATDADGVMYGNERMLAALNGNLNATPMQGYAKHALQHGAGKTLAVRLDFADAYGAGLESLATTPSDAAKTIRGMGLAETAALHGPLRRGAQRARPDQDRHRRAARAAGAGSAERDTRADQPVKLRDKEDARCFA